MYKKCVAFLCEIDNTFNFSSLTEGGLGGSETWILNIARKFNSVGYQVFIFK